jgi:NAD(P)-dependent dehydrogenase (short-subunit alcohol dehydrogenase family)
MVFYSQGADFYSQQFSGLVKNGAKVYLVSRKESQCEDAAKELNKAGPGSAVAIGGDVSSQKGVSAFLEKFKKLESKLDILVNNAGANWGESYDTFPESAFDKIMALNVKGVFLLTRDLTPLLKAAATTENPARVINIGSIDGIRIPELETYSYSASKAAVHQLTKVLANKLATENITVNAIAAGPFQSKMMKVTLDKFGDVIASNTLLGRIGSPEDMAGLCLFLSSRAGAWVTGAIIPLEGGVLAKAKL